DCMTAAGQANAGGVMVTYQAPPYDTNPKLVKFSQDYKKAFNEEPGPYSAYGYNEAAVIIEAMKKTGAKATRESIVKGLHDTKFDGMMGLVEFDAKGELKQPSLYLYKVDGKSF